MAMRSAKRPHRPEAEFFADPTDTAQRRYEALRAYFLEGTTAAQAAARFGYAEASVQAMVRDFRAGDRAFFARRRPGPAAAPAKQAAHDQVLRLRAAGHSVTQIEQALADTPTPLNRTGVWELLRDEGYQRLATRPTGQRGSPHRDHPPRTRRTTWPPQPLRLASDDAGVLLLVPGLVALDLPGAVSAARLPGTREVPALHSALSLLALKAIGRRRVSHVDDVATDPPWPPSRGWSPSQRRPRLAPTPGGFNVATSRRCWPRWARRCCAPARPPGPTSTWTSTRSCTTATTWPWRPTTCPAAPSAPRAC